MSMGIQEHSITRYTVTFDGTYDIDTTVTSFGVEVEAWVAAVLHINQRHLAQLVIGFDVEWRPSFSLYQNPVAVLQLCVGHSCLVFLLLHADYVPNDLLDFLTDCSFTFVGVGIDHDALRLSEDHGISVLNTTDLRGLAAERMDRPELNQKGLAELAKEVMGVEVTTPRRVTMSRWDQRFLNHEQIMYAATDAFLSLEIARRLFAEDF